MTPQERVFVKHMAATNDPTYSATKAGYRSPAPRASMALARPAVQAAILEEQNAALHNEILPLAIRRLRSILENDKVPAAAHVAAIKLVADRTLGRVDGNGASKEPWEMNPAELEAAIQKLQQRAADLAKPVIDHEAEPGIFD